MTRAGLTILLLLLMALPAAAAERALDLLDPQVMYTAQFRVTSDKGAYSGPVWHAPGRERRDFETKSGGQAVLLRRDTDSAYLMQPSGRWYVGLSFSAVGALAGGIDGLTVERAKLKDEQVSGIRATRYKVAAHGPHGARFDGDAWFSREGIMVRAEGFVTEAGGRRSRVETSLSQLKVGRVDERVFELPAGYLAMDLRSVPPERIEQAVQSLKPLLEGRGG